MGNSESCKVLSADFGNSTSRAVPNAEVLMFRGQAADGANCLVAFDSSTIVLSRPVAGLPCRIRLDPRQYQAVAVIARQHGHAVHLLHRDPGLSVDLVEIGALQAAEEYVDRIASLLDLPQLTLAGRSASGETIVSGAAAGRRRVRGTAPRRPRFLARRRKGEVIPFRTRGDEVAARS